MSSATSLLGRSWKRAAQTATLMRAALASGMFGGSLASLALVNRPKDALQHIQYSLFGWRLVKHQGLPQRQFHELFPVPVHVAVELLPTTDYFTWRDATFAKDIGYLALLARTLQPKTAFEIGTFTGYSSLLFALNAPAHAVVYTLDLPQEHGSAPTLATTVLDDAIIKTHAQCPEYLYARAPGGVKVRQLYGDSTSSTSRPSTARVDLFFINGAHSYEYVRSDTRRALECVRPGGTIAWHDYGRWGVNGVSRLLHELAREGREISRLPGSSLAILRA